jgi:DNA-binding LacI/PurR family transcriptional regulator
MIVGYISGIDTGNDAGIVSITIHLLIKEIAMRGHESSDFLQSHDVTIADIARAAGVSVSTVSRILNDKPDVAKKTRQRVLEVIEQTGFTPHAQAQRLRAGSARTIAMIFPLVEYPFTKNISQLELNFMIGASAAAGEEHYFFNLINAPMNEESLLRMFRGNQVDGLVLMEICMHDWRVDLLREHDLPFVMIGRCADNDGLSYIDLDIEAAVIAAVDHLVGMGHHQIGFMSYSAATYEEGLGPAVRGMSGYRIAAEKHGLPILYREVGFGVHDAIDATESLFDQEPELSAVVTVLDTTAVGCMRALHDRGLVVPDDFSVVGVTSENLAQMMVPPLTSIDFSASEMGYKAVKMLTANLRDDSTEAEQILISPRLIERESAGIAPIR